MTSPGDLAGGTQQQDPTSFVVSGKPRLDWSDKSGESSTAAASGVDGPAEILSDAALATEMDELAQQQAADAGIEKSVDDRQDTGEDSAAAKTLPASLLVTAIRKSEAQDPTHVALEDVVSELAAYVDQIFMSVTARLEAMERRFIDSTVLGASAQLMEPNTKVDSMDANAWWPPLKELITDLEAKLVRTEAKLMNGLEASNKRWKDEMRVIWEAVDSHTHDVNVDGESSIAASVQPPVTGSTLNLRHVIKPYAASDEGERPEDDTFSQFLPPGPPLTGSPSGTRPLEVQRHSPWSSVTQSPVRKAEMSISSLDNSKFPDWVWPPSGSAKTQSNSAVASVSIPAPILSGVPTLLTSNAGSYRVPPTGSSVGSYHAPSATATSPVTSPLMLTRSSPVVSSRHSLGAPTSPSLATRTLASPPLVSRTLASPPIVTRTSLSPPVVVRGPQVSPLMVSRAPVVAWERGDFADDVKVIVATSATAPSNAPTASEPTAASPPTLAALAKSLRLSTTSIDAGDAQALASSLRVPSTRKTFPQVSSTKNLGSQCVGMPGPPRGGI